MTVVFLSDTWSNYFFETLFVRTESLEERTTVFKDFYRLFKTYGLRSKPIHYSIYKLRIAYDHKAYDVLKDELLELVSSKAFLEAISVLDSDYFESYEPFLVWLSTYHPDLVNTLREALKVGPFNRGDFLILNQARTLREFHEDKYVLALSEISALRQEIILSQFQIFLISVYPRL